jgi:hypothetical protein
MPLRLTFALTVVVGLLTTTALAEYRTRSQFQKFYPRYESVFQYIVQNNCTEAIDAYIYGTRDNITIDRLGGASHRSVFAQPVIECILENASEYVKSALATSQVILGLTPTILAVMGASTEEAAMLSVVGRRPLLAFLLSAASPSVFTSRAFEYGDLKGILMGKEGRYRSRSRSVGRVGGATGLSRWSRTAVMVVEYAIGLGALVNIGFINYDLSLRTVCGIASDLDFVPALWAVLVICIHGMGVVLVRLRARRTTAARDKPRTPTFGLWFASS